MVHCLLNQRPQLAQIVIHTMNAYAFMDQNLVVIVFLQILMWALPKTPERKETVCKNSGCYKSKRVSMFIIFIPWCNADVSNRSSISSHMVDTMIIYSWSRTRHCWRDFLSSITDFE